MLFYNEKIDASTLPKLALIRDIKCKQLNGEGILSGEVISTNEDEGELLKLVPFKRKKFDTSLSNLWTNSPKTKLFKNVVDDFKSRRESYTIFWLCPLDEQKIIDHVLKNPALIRENGRFDVFTLWNLYIDQMVIFTEDENYKFSYTFVGKLEKLINQLPNAPTKDDWEYLDEMLMK